MLKIKLFIKYFVLILINILLINVCQASISDRRLCADEKCSSKWPNQIL